MPSEEYMDDFSSNCNAVLGDMHRLLQEKHKKYGNRSITKGGYMSIIYKMEMKIERLRTLVATKDDLDELTEIAEWRDDMHDQLIDIANYGLLGIMLLENLFPKEGD